VIPKGGRDNGKKEGEDKKERTREGRKKEERERTPGAFNM